MVTDGFMPLPKNEGEAGLEEADEKLGRHGEFIGRRGEHREEGASLQVVWEQPEGTGCPGQV